ncbi:protein-export membrane protein SecF [Candidatus Atribacteria bacterium RBG_19FT_COMBO_35_14]|uniref:Protein-export membrane protein SecF n=1 Tax=Candidatus Sediminicultor quintus TaxID=1797291 RepID=A0A1F5A9S5_9BACT|nr:MAG: protein-export membrane protein SecF [Candidatus Atribacteria bacterium RBG_19FT_COMBO_35_14]
MDLIGKKGFDFIKNRKIAYIISVIIILVGLISIIFQGFNLGIDFAGGTLLQIKFDKSVSTTEVRNVLSEFNLSQSTIQNLSENEFVIRIGKIDSEQRTEILTAFKENLTDLEVLRVETVGPVIGENLKKLAFYALLFAFIGIILYITVRFEFKFSIVSILALCHDSLIVLGIFSLLQKEITISIIAAVMTIVGYSINNTIVILDRLRENIKFKTREPFENLINMSINQSLSRTINTTLTTIIPILTLYFFGGNILSDFALALFIGMLAGTYSSIFIASPLLLEWNKIFKIHQKGIKISREKDKK